MRVLLTGATGFLGYHIAKACIKTGHQLLCLHRETSISLFSENDEKKIKWFSLSDTNYKQIINDFVPEVLIHAAWQGVSSVYRNDEKKQLVNMQLFMDVINLYTFNQIIVLGSQDEYGFINQIVVEDYPIKPQSEYAKNKNYCCQQLQYFSKERGYEWQWIRVFSVYGEKQQANWLIPSLISNCINGVKEMETTKGEQIYSYLYSSDFARAITSIIGQYGKCGIYNLSSMNPISLKELFEMIKKLTRSDIQFIPRLPYRENQSMMMVGDSSKFIRTFGTFELTSLEQGLKNMITLIRKNNEII